MTIRRAVRACRRSPPSRTPSGILRESPTLSREAARWLADQGVKAVVLDSGTDVPALVAKTALRDGLDPGPPGER